MSVEMTENGFAKSLPHAPTPRDDSSQGDTDVEIPFLPNQAHPPDSIDRSGDEESFTVEDAVETMGFGPFQLWMVGYTGVSWLADAMEMILLSYVGPAARCQWGLTADQEGFISSVVFLGVFLGSFTWGTVSDIKGRRPGYLVTACFTFIFGLLSAWAPHYWVLLLCRFLVGFGIGGSPVILSLCSEFLPSSSRGFWLVFIEFFWTIGSLAEALLAWLIMPHLHWRVLVLVSALPFLLLMVCYPLLPESPRFLMVQGEEAAALQVLQKVAKWNKKKLPRGRLVLAQEEGEAVASGGVEAFPIDAPPPKSPSAWLKLKKLVAPPLLKSTLLLWLVFYASAFAYYGQVLLTTQLEVTGGGGATRCGGDGGGGVGRGLMPLDGTLTGVGQMWLGRQGVGMGEGDRGMEGGKGGAGTVSGQSFGGGAGGVPVEGIAGRARQLSAVGGREALGDTEGCLPGGLPIIPPSTYLDVFVTSLAELPGVVTALLIVGRVGRKGALALLTFVSGLCLIPLWAVQSEGLTTMLLFAARGSITGSFAILWAYAPELYPTDVRATGVGVGNAWSRLGGFTCPFVAVGMVASCQRAWAIALFSVIPIAAAGATLLFPKEGVMGHPKHSSANLERARGRDDESRHPEASAALV